MNLQGAKFDIPFHVNYGNERQAHNHRNDPIEAEEIPMSEDSRHLPENTASSSSSAARHPSILRKGMNTATARARGPSISQRKHVDFSLGMSNMASNDIMGDVFEDRGVRIDDVVRTANREASERRIQEEAEDEEERRSRTSSSRHRRPSNLSAPSNKDEGRRSTDAHSFRSGQSSLSRNRFFHHRSSVTQERDDLMEQGRSASPTQPPPAAVPGVKEHPN